MATTRAKKQQGPPGKVKGKQKGRGKAAVGKLRARREQSPRKAQVKDERAVELRHEISRKLAEGRALRKQIEQRIDQALRERGEGQPRGR